MPSIGEADPEAAIRPTQAASSRELQLAMSGEVAGGLASALVAIPQAMSLGLQAFVILGPEYASAGVIAGLLASVIGAFMAAVLPGSRCQIMGPRASATVVFSGFLAMLAAHPLLQTAQGANIPQILTLAFFGVFCAGLLQIVFGVTGLGRAIKFVPYPVIAGFMNGVALVIIASQLGPALGFDAGRSALAALAQNGAEAIRPASAIVATVVVVTIFTAPRFFPRVPAMLLGLVAGIGIHYVAAWFFPGSTGPVVGALPKFEWLPYELAAMFDVVRGDHIGIWLGIMLPNALLLAGVVSLDGLLASVVGDSVTHGRHDGRRVLVGQGLASAFGAAFGAIPIASNVTTRIVSYVAGGRTAMAALFHAFFVLLAIVALGPIVGGVPIAALAGLMITIGITLFDHWTRDLLRRLMNDNEHRTEILFNLAVVAAVALSLFLVSVTTAFALGIAAAVVMLLVKLSRSPVRRMVDGNVRTSLKVRSPDARAALRSVAGRIQIVELQGDLFFGTADRLQSEIEGLRGGARYLILDFRRVNQVDATAARVLQILARVAERRGTHILLSHVGNGDSGGRYLKALGIAQAVPPERWFLDLDRALEWAEDALLGQRRFEDAPELALRDVALMSGLTEDELATLSASMERHELGHGDPVFLEGDEGDRVYLITRGAVSIKIRLDTGERALRLATFTPGVFFGEMSLIEGQHRTADAFAKGDRVVLYSLAAAQFAELVRAHPQIGLKIYQNLSRELVARLRVTTGALRSLE